MDKDKRILITVLVCIIAAGLLAGFFIYARRAGKISRVDNIQTAEAFHYSYFSQPEFFDAAYRAAKPQPYRPQVKAIIVNHHLLAANYIAESFNVVATNASVTVLLISPNHFNAGKADVITSAESWQTPYGILPTDGQLINQLTTSGMANIEESPFEQEHGVSGLVAFLKRSLPNAKVVPLIFKNRMNLDKILALADRYHQTLEADKSKHHQMVLDKSASATRERDGSARYMLIGSFDFSHYLSSRAADFHDIENLADVENFNFSNIYDLDIDSRPGLAFFLELVKDQGDQNFHLLENSNSAKLLRQDILETTSYINGYFTPLEVGRQRRPLARQRARLLTGFTAGAAQKTAAATLLSLPSVAPSEQTLAQIQKNNPGYALTYLERLFYGQGATVAFLEKPNPVAAEILKRLGIEVLGTDRVIKILGRAKTAIVDCQKGNKGVKWEQGVARLAIDSGAETAVCQGAVKNRIETYKNKPIVYASGNLLDGEDISKLKNSLAVGLAYKNNQLRIFLLPIGANNGQLELLVGKKSDKVLADMAMASDVDESMKKQIESGVVTISAYGGNN